MWTTYGYLVAAPPASGNAGTGRYLGISRAAPWPVVDEIYWTNPQALPQDVKEAYYRISVDPGDFLLLRVVRSQGALKRLVEFIRASGVLELDVLIIEVDSSVAHAETSSQKICWLGYEPYARGEWGLLSLLEGSPALADWIGRLNDYGLLPSPQAGRDFAADYTKAMGRPGGPEPIADDAVIDVLHVGLLPDFGGEQ